MALTTGYMSRGREIPEFSPRISSIRPSEIRLEVVEINLVLDSFENELRDGQVEAETAEAGGWRCW